LRLRTLVSTTLTLIALISLLYSVLGAIVLEGFSTLEVKEAQHSPDSAIEAL
jgi:sensor domain CHASE-containing protein